MTRVRPELAKNPPPDLRGVGITEKQGEKLSLDLTFRDERGQTVPLSSFFHAKRPVVLSFGYYECPMLCGLVFNGLTEGFKGLELKPGRDYEWVNISINPKETSALAASKKQTFVDAAGDPSLAQSWHFLTGDEASIQKLAAQAGYGYRYDEGEKEYLHGAGVIVLTPEGKVSRTLYGIQYAPKDLRLAFVEAGEGKTGTVIDRILLFCYQYNPHTRTYSLIAFRVMQAGGAGTVVLMGGYFLLFWRRQRRRSSVGKGV